VGVPSGRGKFLSLCFLLLLFRALLYCWHQAALVVAIHWIKRAQHPVVRVKLPKWFSDVFSQEFVENTNKIPNFDDKGKRPEMADMEGHEQLLAAVRALTRELRVQMQRSGRYGGSKLELLDQFNVKISELSCWPIYLVPWKCDLPKTHTAHSSKGAKRKKKEEEKADHLTEEPKRTGRERKPATRSKDFVY
jgi:hypothetical protein